MRRNYISPEFDYYKVNGTLNMLEHSTFFGSKMIDIEDIVSIINEDIVYYQSSTNEQLNFIVENSLPAIIYNTIKEKKLYHTININKNQSEQQKTLNTKWEININIKKILSDHLFSLLKKYRTFEGINNNMTLYNDVNIAINNYIEKNILTKYKYDHIDFYVSYLNLKNNGVLQYNVNFNQLIESTQNLCNKIQIDPRNTIDSLLISFTQEKVSKEYTFDYYFNLYFSKI